jgi:hypothetical protein
MKLKPATQGQADTLQRALHRLHDARIFLKIAGCPAALAAVRRAIKSAEGAERHMQRRLGATRAPDTPGYRDAPRAPEITNGPPRATRAPEVQS